MKQLKIEIDIDICQPAELSETERMLVERAVEATRNAYAKYSRFYVGAAALLADGQVFVGANQENAAFPSGLCAERTAIFAAQANCPEQPVTMLAIAARNDAGPLSQPVTPCGACRQVVLEIEDRYQQPVEILLNGSNGVYRAKSIKDLLPLSFVDSNMR